MLGHAADGGPLTPLFEGKLALPTLPGIQQVSLAKLISLPKTDYDWSISVVAAGVAFPVTWSPAVKIAWRIRRCEGASASAQRTPLIAR